MSERADPALERLRKKKLKELKQLMTPPAKIPNALQGVIRLTTNNFDQTIKEGITLVDFFAEWCGPCKIMAPVIDKLAQEFTGRAKFAKVDVDMNFELARRYSVQGVPTFGIFKDGQMVHRIVGGVGYQPLKAALDKILN